MRLKVAFFVVSYLRLQTDFLWQFLELLVD